METNVLTDLIGKYVRLRHSSSGKYAQPWSHRDTAIWGDKSPGPTRLNTTLDNNFIALKDFDPKDPSQLFWLFPAGNDHFFIFLRGSEFVWDISLRLSQTADNFWRLFGRKSKRDILHYPYNGGDNQQFLFRPTATGAETVRIGSKYGHFEGAVGVDDLNDPIYFVDQDANANQAFAIEGSEPFANPPRALRPPQIQPYGIDVSAVPRLKTADDTHPDRTEPQIIGESYIPFLMVHDRAYSRARQAVEFPIYIMRREQFWWRAADMITSADVEFFLAENVKFGITESHALSITASTGIEFDMKFSTPNYPALNAILPTVKANLKIDSTTELSYKRAYNYDKGFQLKTTGRKRVAVWLLIDRYVVERPGHADDKNVAITEVVVSPATGRFVVDECPIT